MIHVLDASLHGHWRGRIQSNDNDNVLVMPIDPILQLDKLSHLFGSSKQVRYLPSQALATSLGREKGVLQTILSYNRPSSLCKVNEVKQQFFSRKARSLERIPRSQESLLHLKRAVFQWFCKNPDP